MSRDEIKVKWHGCLSKERELNGGGPRGLLEYDSQTNNNCNFVAENKQFKVVDDLSLLEIFSLILIGLTSYNFKNHVASDIGLDKLYLQSENIKSGT